MHYDGENDLQGEDGRSTIPPMTVCVAAICDGGKAVIVAADRSVAYGSQSFHPNGPDCKISPIASRTVIAVADSPPGADLFSQLFQEQLLGEEPSQIAEHVRGAMQKRLKDEVEINVLAMRGNKWKNYDEFWNDPSHPHELRGEVAAYTLDTRVIIAGVGNAGARLYRIDRKAFKKPVDEPGFAAIGAGEELAMHNLFARSLAIKNMGIGEAAYYVYEAKKMAERHRGVGDATDMVIIRDSIVTVTIEQMEELNSVYQNLKARDLTKASAQSITCLLTSSPTSSVDPN